MAGMIQRQSRAGEGYVAPQAAAGIGDLMGGIMGGMGGSKADTPSMAYGEGKGVYPMSSGLPAPQEQQGSGMGQMASAGGFNPMGAVGGMDINKLLASLRG